MLRPVSSQFSRKPPQLEPRSLRTSGLTFSTVRHWGGVAELVRAFVSGVEDPTIVFIKEACLTRSQLPDGTLDDRFPGYHPLLRCDMGHLRVSCPHTRALQRGLADVLDQWSSTSLVSVAPVWWTSSIRRTMRLHAGFEQDLFEIFIIFAGRHLPEHVPS